VSGETRCVFHHGHDRPVPGDQLAGGAVIREQCEPDGTRRRLGWIAADRCRTGIEIRGPQAGRERVDLDAVASERLRVEDVSALSAVFDERYAAPEPVPAPGSRTAVGAGAPGQRSVPLEMLTMRGCGERRSAGRKALVTATTPKTLVS